MPAKWQQWMPLHIERFTGSAAVQAMHPCARAGYLYLLMDAWQSEDCTVTTNPLELASRSGLGERMWKQHGPMIVSKFVTVTVPVGERLRNEVQFEEWLEAKRIYESRHGAADRTNAARKAKRSPSTPIDTVTVSENRDGDRNDQSVSPSPSFPPYPLSNPTSFPTGEAQGTRDSTPERSPSEDWDADPTENIPDGLSPIQYAVFVLQECAIPASYALKVKTGDAIGMLAREEGCTMPEATRLMLGRMGSAAKTGGVKWLFWLEDGGWKRSKEGGVSTEGME